MNKNIFLIGFMGTGKTSVAQCLAKELHMKRSEMDDLIVEQEGMSISDIFLVKGELYFRNAETELLKKIQKGSNQVISCGGGVVLRKENIDLMKANGKVVLLTASPTVIFERVKHDEKRPLLKEKKNVEAIAELMGQRKSYYECAADITIKTDNKTITEICDELIESIRE